MGSDLYMEANNFRPRANKGEWHGEELHILVDRFYHGYELLWKGKVTPDNESLVKVMLPGGIPPKPEPMTPNEQAVYNVIEHWFGGYRDEKYRMAAMGHLLEELGLE